MDIGNFENDDNQNGIVNNFEEKVNIISNEENITQKDESKIKIEGLKDEKEEKIISNKINENKNIKDTSPAQKQNSRKIFYKHLNQKKIKKVKNAKPILIESILDLNKSKKISKNDTKNKSTKISYLNSFKNEKSEITDLKDSNVNKTVFSKISENLYDITKNETLPDKKARNLELEKEENYNKLTEEAFLCSCANKGNKENTKIISEFLGRKKNEEISKIIGIDSEREKKNELESFHDIKRKNILTDRNRSYVSSRTVQDFLNDQKSKEEKHIAHLKTNEELTMNTLNSILRDRPCINKETIKLANKINRSTNVDIHSRLYQEYNNKKKKLEEKMKENNIYVKNDQRKLSKVKIKENVERLFHEYEVKKKKRDENESKKINEIRNLSSNHSTSKISNEIILKKFRKMLENSLESIINKKIDETFDISYMDFIKLLFNIKFTTKDYFLLIEKKNNGKNDENSESNNILDKTNKTNKLYTKNTNYENDKEYKLINDAWKIIIKSKELKIDALGSSKRLLLFFLSIFGLYNENINNNFIKREYSFMINDINIVKGSSNNFSTLSKQIYKYFSLYRNNAINGLLLRDKDSKMRLELESEMERSFTFSPSLEKSSKAFLDKNRSSTEMRLNVQKNYEQYRKNRELKLKEKEKLLEKEEKEKCPFVPFSPKTKEKKNITLISNRLYSTRLHHIKNNSSISNNLLTEGNKNKIPIEEKAINFNSNNNSIHRMFNNNPLEKDLRVKKKIKELKETKKQKSYEKFILKNGFKPKENNSNLYEYNEFTYERFVHEDEPLNTFKNTFEKYERFEKKRGKKVKYIFEIIVDNKPKNLIIYPDEDINYKVKVFCNIYKLNYNDKTRILQAINHQLKGKNNCYQ